MSSPEAVDTRERDRVLLDIARRSVEAGVATGAPLPVRPADYGPPLCEPGASFVTLRRSGELRGCIGSLEANRPLVEDVAANAFSAAFRDPRFPPVGADELPDLDIHLSLLGTPESLEVHSEEELLEVLRPGIDGLVLIHAAGRGTFLPQVWEQLPEPREFVHALERKAGLRPGDWSDRWKFQRYTVESIP